MSQLKSRPFRYRWMLVTTIIAAVSAAVCYIGQFVRIRMNAYYNALADGQEAIKPELNFWEHPAYELKSRFNEYFSYWMMIPIFVAFLAILLFLVVSAWEQYSLTRLGGGVFYGVMAVALLIPAACYAGAMINYKYTILVAVLFGMPFLMIGVLFMSLLAVRVVRQRKPASAMFSPWIGVPGYIALFVLCFGPFAAGNYSATDPGGLVETWLMTILMGMTVLLMIVDTALYHHTLKRRQSAA
ncbi:MAG TPA: hypothetical protein IAB39_02470 [Candidatus Onthovicinus excrementipullorum]|nr:hypothetical protein [Candidatus Onthovicinus excrementipullorum]